MTIVSSDSDSHETPLWFAATFSVDTRVLEPGHELTIKVATSLGYSASDAVDIARVVGDGMSRVLALAKDKALRRLELTFCTGSDAFEVSVVCDGTSYCHVTTALPSLDT